MSKTVVITTDFSDAAAAAYAEAAREAKSRGCELLLLHVLDDWGIPFAIYEGLQPDLIEKMRADISANAAKQIEAVKQRYFKGAVIKTAIEPLSARSVGEALCSFAESHHAELIVMSSRGHNLLSEMFVGSVTHAVIQRAPCPVLVVRAPVAKK